MSTLTLEQRRLTTITIFDILALAFVYFVPTIAHLTAVPIYLFEPMRIVIILSLVHTHKYNAYVLAATVPLFSFLISGHPEFLKMLIMTAELILNVWLFLLLKNKFKNLFLPALLSIVASKAVYYIGKYLLVHFALIQMSLFSTPLYIQAITTIVLTLYAGIVYYYKAKE